MSFADRIRNRSWAILPCSRILFRKNKVKIKDLITTWSSGTVVICKEVETGKVIFIAGSGDGGYAKPGEIHGTHHDQEGYSLGNYRILDEVFYAEQPDKTVSIRSHHQAISQNYLEELALLQAPVYCFK